MTDVDPPGRRSIADVPDLIDDYRRQRDAWSHQALELARMRAGVVAAAQSEAAALLASTRSRIARAVSEARRELLGLAAQVQALPDAPDESTKGLAAARDHILDARRELKRALEEVRPEIERLSADARALSVRGPSQPDRAVTSPDHFATAANGEDDFTISRGAAPYAEVEANEPIRTYQATSQWRAAPIAATVAIAVVAAVAVWQLRGRIALAPARTASAQPIAVAGPPNAASARATEPPPPGHTAPADAGHRAAITLRVETIGPAWIRTTVDGRADAGRVFATGEKKTVVAEREVVLRAGDAGAVFVALNGGELKALGPRGIVATRRFALDPAPTPVARPDANAPAVAPPKPSSSAAAITGPSAVSTPAASAAALVPTAPPTPSTDPIRKSDDRTSMDNATLSSAAERWLDAYYRQDAATLASIAARDMKLSDERVSGERLPPGLPNVRRSLEGVGFQFVGDSAVLSGRMVENATINSEPAQRVAWISQMWLREGAQWRLTDVHILSDSKLKQTAPKR